MICCICTQNHLGSLFSGAQANKDETRTVYERIQFDDKLHSLSRRRLCRECARLCNDDVMKRRARIASLTEFCGLNRLVLEPSWVVCVCEWVSVALGLKSVAAVDCQWRRRRRRWWWSGLFADDTVTFDPMAWSFLICWILRLPSLFRRRQLTHANLI